MLSKYPNLQSQVGIISLFVAQVVQLPLLALHDEHFVEQTIFIIYIINTCANTI